MIGPCAEQLGWPPEVFHRMNRQYWVIVEFLRATRYRGKVQVVPPELTEIGSSRLVANGS